MFDRKAMEACAADVAAAYFGRAEIVECFADHVCTVRDTQLTIAMVALLQRLRDEKPDPLLAENLVQHCFAAHGIWCHFENDRTAIGL